MKLQPIKCPCEQGFHTVDIDNPMWRDALQLIKDFGETIEVQYIPTNSIYIIPRFYIAIHGITGAELSMLGFPKKEEVRE